LGNAKSFEWRWREYLGYLIESEDTFVDVCDEKGLMARLARHLQSKVKQVGWLIEEERNLWLGGF
jgi:hypothetical protein